MGAEQSKGGEGVPLETQLKEGKQRLEAALSTMSQSKHDLWAKILQLEAKITSLEDERREEKILHEIQLDAEKKKLENSKKEFFKRLSAVEGRSKKTDAEMQTLKKEMEQIQTQVAEGKKRIHSLGCTLDELGAALGKTLDDSLSRLEALKQDQFTSTNPASSSIQATNSTSSNSTEDNPSVDLNNRATPVAMSNASASTHTTPQATILFAAHPYAGPTIYSQAPFYGPGHYYPPSFPNAPNLRHVAPRTAIPIHSSTPPKVTKGGKAAKVPNARAPSDTPSSAPHPSTTSNTKEDLSAALISAAKGGQGSEVRRLLALGAAVDSENSVGESALHCAALEGHVDAACALLDAGADVECRTQFSATPLHFAARKGRNAAVALLLQRGAAVDAKNERKQTPLHYAAVGGHEECVRVLLKEGAEAHAMDIEGKTPWDVTYSYAVRKLLRPD